jgi:septum formation protein
MRFIQKRAFVLASGSPRRKQYFQSYQFNFRIQKTAVDESINQDEQPSEMVTRLSEAKAHAVVDGCKPQEIIVAADTIVVLDQLILGKPENREKALAMLQKLNGKTHTVISAYSILDPGDLSCLTRTAVTEVKFKQVPLKFLQAYSSTQDPLDKAGAYSIQGPGTFLVQAIRGSYNNVVGLPIELLIEDLSNSGLLSPLQV